jgi:hypothetical protein
MKMIGLVEWYRMAGNYERATGEDLQERWELAKNQGDLWDDGFAEYAMGMIRENPVYTAEYQTMWEMANPQGYIPQDLIYTDMDAEPMLGFVPGNCGAWTLWKKGEKVDYEDTTPEEDAVMATLKSLAESYSDDLFEGIIRQEIKEAEEAEEEA